MTNIVIVGWNPEGGELDAWQLIRNALMIPGKGYEKQAVISGWTKSFCVEAVDLVTPAPYLIVRDTVKERMSEIAHTLNRILNIDVEMELINDCLIAKK